MKKKIFKILLITTTIIILIIFGFRLYVKYKVGIDFSKFGKPISISSIIKYNNQLSPNDSIFYLIKQKYYHELGKGDFPKVKLFKNKKELIINNCYEDLPFIVDKYDEIIKKANNNNFPFAIKQNSLQDELKKITTLDGRDVRFNDPDRYAYTLIYYYGLWSKKLNERKLLPLIKKYEKADSIKLFIVNCDTIAKN